MSPLLLRFYNANATNLSCSVAVQALHKMMTPCWSNRVTLAVGLGLTGAAQRALGHETFVEFWGHLTLLLSYLFKHPSRCC